ncbi:MAG: TetR/AcrR family transcriptional regulator [Propionibacteriaceae bacterium]|uniref:TetR/AcrR family transcriptional regulator n=1 Tax=unclassified Brevibacterium TaxID=2614124 RepID=UPI003CF138E3
MRPRVTSRDQIDRIALELFLAHGYAEVTTDELIQACGVSRPTFFRYVASRDSLVLDHIAQFGQGVAAMVRERVEASAWVALREAMCDAVEMLDPGSREGMAFRILQSSPGIRSSALELTRTWRGQLTESLVAGEYFAGDDRQCEAAAAMAIGLFQMTWASPGATPSSTSALLRRAFDDAVNLVV